MQRHRHVEGQRGAPNLTGAVWQAVSSGLLQGCAAIGCLCSEQAEAFSVSLGVLMA